ncbi:MAG: hypothetical protein A2Y15_08615 [Clostridiales bacterium GWF2_36_10]|nr:MAG: hypothetical protein A2Y15_08615 [Clostridiales bacterium GWF2_36_10]HAN20406.1 hypothetical protein [Clostridiales bacterium]
MEENKLLHRILNLRVKKVDVLKELNARGIRCYPSQFSDAVNGNYPYRTEKTNEIITNVDKILTDWENEREVKSNANRITTGN